MIKKRFEGVLVPAITPFKADLSPDPDAFLRVCKWLLAEGANGLAVFGTTSEANSLSLGERMSLLDELVAAGVDPSLLLPGTSLPSVEDTIVLTSHAVSHGCGGTLMLPPFYYKPVSDEGLFSFYSQVIERIGSADLRIWLYHIPQNTGVGISHDLIERLIARYPKTVVGIKDSSGVWDNVEGMLKRFPDFSIFPSSEAWLLKSLGLGAAGCITATANVNVRAIRRLYDGWKAADAEDRQAEVADIRTTIARYPLIPAVKLAMAERLGEPGLALLRPPLTALPQAEANSLLTALRQAGLFTSRP